MITPRLIVLTGFLLSPVAVAETRTLTVQETAGLRRFGYPVHTLLSWKGISDKDRFRLLEDGKPVVAQFRPFGKGVALDFNVSIGPKKSKIFKVEYGADVVPGPELRGGMTVEESDETITVRTGGMAYVVRRDLGGLLDNVRSAKMRYLRLGSSGLTVDNVPIMGTDKEKVQVAYHGPLTTLLRLARRPGGGLDSPVVVELTFPRSKSWVEVLVRRDNPGKKPPTKAITASLNLEVESKPTLVDFGTASVTYTTLATNEAASLTCSGVGRWEVRTGKPPKLDPFAVATFGSAIGGWAHLMDNKRCTALAIDRFGLHSRDSILAEANGKLTWSREFDRNPEASRSLRFWLHFVSMPVQVGAVTSPQSMMAPLQVEVK